MSQTAAGLARTDSLEAQDPHHAQDEDKKKKSRRPASMFFTLLYTCLGLRGAERRIGMEC